MSESPPTRLYKYLPSRYLDAFVHRGEILFRNMAYFRKIEDKGRADLLEGLHVDRPDGGLMLTRQDGTALHYDGVDSAGRCNTLYYFTDLEGVVHGTVRTSWSFCDPESGVVATLEKGRVAE